MRTMPIAGPGCDVRAPLGSRPLGKDPWDLMRPSPAAPTSGFAPENIQIPIAGRLQVAILTPQKPGAAFGRGVSVRQVNKVGIASKPREIEAALCESEQRLRWLASIIDSSDDAIV